MYFLKKKSTKTLHIKSIDELEQKRDIQKTESKQKDMKEKPLTATEIQEFKTFGKTPGLMQTKYQKRIYYCYK